MTATQAKRGFEKLATNDGRYWRSKTGSTQLKQMLRGLKLDSFRKQADLGGDPEGGFEQAFSSLAYSYIKDKAPRLIDYIIGFQLVDRNEDNTKAMGVFGFKVGDEWLYAPIFFLNRDLKGHELLYIKKQDTFVPMKENWINYIISRKPHMLGEGSPRDTYQLGGLPPDIYRLTHPPTSSKYGSDANRPLMDNWAKPFLGLLSLVATKKDALFTKHAEAMQRLDLRSFLGQSFTLLKAAYDLCEVYPLLKTGFDKFYGKNFFSDVARQIKRANDSLIVPTAPTVKKPNSLRPRNELSRQKSGSFSLISAAPKPQHPCKTGSLRIHLYNPLTLDSTLPSKNAFSSLISDEAALAMKAAADKGKLPVDRDAESGILENTDLSEEERGRLLRDTVLIDDKRNPEDISVVVNTQVEVALTNPSDTGIYKVLEKAGQFDRMLVVMHPQTNRRREEFATVVRLDDPRNWLNVHATKLYVKATPEPERDDFRKWFEKLESVKPEKEGHYIAIGPNGAGTTPFCVREIYEDEIYTVDFKDHASWNSGKSSYLRGDVRTSWDDTNDETVSTYDARVYINKYKGCKLRAISGELSIPEEFKIMKLMDPPPPPKKNKGYGEIMCSSSLTGPRDAGSAEHPIQPGNLVDIQIGLYEKTANIKLHDTGAGEIWITSPNGHELMTKKAAFVALIRDHGCHEIAAREMLKAAATASLVNNAVSYRIKYADWVKQAEPFSNSALQPGPGSPAFPMPQIGMERVGPSAYPAYYPQEEFHPIQALNSNRTDPMIYDPFYQPDQRAMQVAQEAGASGQKEVFDTTMIGNMLKAVRQDNLVDKHLGDLITALDKLGKILLMFYWHQEEFEDRYGKQDLPELEDGLRNAFDALGDITLFLKEKQVGGSMSDMMGSVGNKAEPDIQELARN
jgi:hypothetical protein